MANTMIEECPVCNMEYQYEDFYDFEFDFYEGTCTTVASFECDECGHGFTVERKFKLVPQERTIVDID